MDLNYQSYLHEKIGLFIQERPGVSLRSIAMNAGLSPSHLSRVLKGEKRLSSESALALAKTLKLNQKDTSLLQCLLRAEKTTSPKIRSEMIQRAIRLSNSKTMFIDAEKFRLISDWYHFAILALSKTKTFKHHAKYIAQRLGISSSEARLAIERLIRLGIITIENGKVKEAKTEIETSDDVQNSAIQKWHRETLTKAIDALESQSLEEREFQGVHLSVKQSQIPAVKARIREFIKAINAEFDTDGGDEVYQVSAQLFRLSNKNQYVSGE